MTKRLPAITIARVYDAQQSEAGYRVLVDRLWPRGIKKEDLHLDEWAKDLAPSTELRKWFGHDPQRWSEFKRRYQQELKSNLSAVDELLEKASRRRITLLFAARDEEHCHAIVLQDFLETRRSQNAKRS